MEVRMTKGMELARITPDSGMVTCISLRSSSRKASNPDIERETAIIRAKAPNVNEHLAVQVAQAIHDLRQSEHIRIYRSRR